MKSFRHLLLLVVALFGVGAFAEIEIPKASGKALGVTKGRSFSSGLVFVDGRYIEPPYVVERWGNGIRINKTPVIGQVVEWTEFLKTQDGLKVTKTERAPVEEKAESEEETKAAVEQESATTSDTDSTSLDDLFDDDAQPKKDSKKPEKVVRKPKPAKPAVTVSYALEGEFKSNDASKALVKKINKVRTDINAILLSGGFICFGERYSRISGDSRTADQILSKLPDIQRTSDKEADLSSGIRAAGLVFLTEPVCADLFRNRRDYLKLKARRDKEKDDRAFNKLLDDAQQKPRY